jgi:hypothetical protein
MAVADVSGGVEDGMIRSRLCSSFLVVNLLRSVMRLHGV